MRWVRKPERGIREERTHCFQDRNDSSKEYCFPVDEHGNLKFQRAYDGEIMNPKAAVFYAEYKEDPDLIDVGFKSRQRRYFRYGIIKCVCGSELTLVSSWANDCRECERTFSGDGQLLAIRELWGT